MAVNAYLESGFATSEIDLWFNGPPPVKAVLFMFEQPNRTLDQALQEMHEALQDNTKVCLLITLLQSAYLIRGTFW